MGTKKNPGTFDCYANAEDDEPMFVLLARDVRAPEVIELWCQLSEAKGTDPEKIKEARKCISEMRDWRRRRFHEDHLRIGISTSANCAMCELIRIEADMPDEIGLCTVRGYES
jgi:hypothetical protein